MRRDDAEASGGGGVSWTDNDAGEGVEGWGGGWGR
jgi:hypothetical protein